MSGGRSYRRFRSTDGQPRSNVKRKKMDKRARGRLVGARSRDDRYARKVTRTGEQR